MTQTRHDVLSYRLSIALKQTVTKTDYNVVGHTSKIAVKQTVAMTKTRHDDIFFDENSA